MTKGQVSPEQESSMIPGAFLEALATRLRLHRTEWRIVALILAAPGPVSARAIAKRLGIAYSPVKRSVRDLIAWRILERVPTGIVFQPDPAKWGPPGDQIG